MSKRFVFDQDMLNSVAGGRSAIDIPRLNIHTKEAAESFILTYGYDVKKTEDQDKLWYFHRRALVLLTERLGFKEAEIPAVIRDRKQLVDITHLLLLASSLNTEEKELQKWACAVLRCMHVYVHAEQDLFSSFSEEIQSQILAPFQNVIVNDGAQHKTFLRHKSTELPEIELLGFEVKPFKTSTSTVIKLLAKPDALAMKVFDKLGVRFVTKSLFDTFQVIRFLVEEHLISFPHIMPDQSSNNLYPVELFMSVCHELKEKDFPANADQLNQLFENRLQQHGQSSGLFRKINEQSGQDFRFIKFITRKLVHVSLPGKEPFSFFYPFEVQIMDQQAYSNILSGPSEHESYKERQRKAARQRIFPELKDTAQR